MFPLHALLFSLRVIVVYPGFITCYFAPHKLQSNYMSFRFSHGSSHQQAFILSSRIWGTHCAQIFVISKCSHKIMSTSSAISSILTQRFCNTVFSIARQFSLQRTSHGRHVKDFFSTKLSSPLCHQGI